MKKLIIILLATATVGFSTSWLISYATQLKINSGQVILRNSVLNINPKYPDFAAQRLQTIDDWVNSGGTSGEYILEEATWSVVAGSPFAGYNTLNYLGATNLYSGAVKQDARTGLWWSDIMAVGATASTTSNVFGNATDGVRPTGGNAIGFCDALNTANFGGYNNWYLPTQKQLMQAYIDGSANNLPNPDNYFWSASEKSWAPTGAWLVILSYGNTGNNTKVTSYYVRCVRP